MSVSTVLLPRFAAVCFFATGVPFGVVMGIVMASTALGAIAGAAFGVLMTATIGGLQWVTARSGAGLVGVHQSDRFVVTNSLDAIESLSEVALFELGADRPRIETSGDVVVLEGRTSMSWRSWSEIVRIELGPRVGDTTPVHVSSRPAWRTTIADYGKNLANVRAIRAALCGTGSSRLS